MCWALRGEKSAFDWNASDLDFFSQLALFFIWNPNHSEARSNGNELKALFSVVCSEFIHVNANENKQLNIKHKLNKQLYRKVNTPNTHHPPHKYIHQYTNDVEQVCEMDAKCQISTGERRKVIEGSHSQFPITHLSIFDDVHMQF